MDTYEVKALHDIGRAVYNAARREAATYRQGDRVQVTATGRTATWPHYLKGTVEETWQDRVYVQWDGTTFSDEMTTDEVQHVS
jgi:hypothetical protein